MKSGPMLISIFSICAAKVRIADFHFNLLLYEKHKSMRTTDPAQFYIFKQKINQGLE